MNLRRLLKAGFIWSGILYSFASYGQEAPLGALPMQYNSSFAGEAGGPRLSSNFNFHPGSKSNHSRYYDLYASYDQFIPAIRTGIGITAGWGIYESKPNNITSYNDYIAKGNNNFLSVAIAPKFSLKGKYTLSPSVDFTYQPRSFSFIDYAPSTQNYSIKGHQLQSRIGLLFNTNKYYVGYSVHLLTWYTNSLHLKDSTTFLNFGGKDTTLTSSGSGLHPFLSYLQMGYTFQRSATSKFSFTPQLVLRITANNPFNNHYVNLEAINLNFKYQQVIFGANNRGWHVGWQTDKLRVMLSNKFVIKDLGDYRGSLSFRYLIRNNSNRSPNLASGY